MIRSSRDLRTLGTIAHVLMISLVGVRASFGLITGQSGAPTIAERNAPKGAVTLANSPGCIAWWVGPPFGGGQYHLEYRGDAKALNAFLADFAQLDAKTKRVIVHDGVGNSFWLNPNRQAEKQAAATMDWSCMFWTPASWDRLSKMPADLNPARPQDIAIGPPAEVEVYAGGSIRWSDVSVPKGIEVVDDRLEAHGYSGADGVVLEGKVSDVASKEPLAARMRMERVMPRPQGGYDYPFVSEVAAEAQGHWVMKSVPPGWYRIIAEADGYVARIVTYVKPDEQPRWSSYGCQLAHGAIVAGRVVDEGGMPLADVDVRLRDVSASDGGRYQTPDELSARTDANGEFHFDKVPAGSAKVVVSKSGYCRPGVGEAITTPKDAIELKMIEAGEVTVTMRFGEKARPEGYLVEIEPEGGSVVGSWGGSAHIDKTNRVVFKNVPPGKYFVGRHPNPTSESDRTEKVAVYVGGGKAEELELQAK